MKSKTTFLITCGALAVIIGTAAVLYNVLSDELKPNKLTETSHESQSNSEDSDSPSKDESAKAPDFTVYDIDGNPVSLSDFLGKPVIVNFWASWCGPCKSEMPDFETVYKEHENDIQFLIINMTDGSSETVETAYDFIAESGYTFPVYYDTDMDAASTYSVYSIPATYFIDSEGYIVAKGSGALDLESLYKGIDMINK